MATDFTAHGGKVKVTVGAQKPRILDNDGQYYFNSAGVFIWKKFRVPLADLRFAGAGAAPANEAAALTAAAIAFP